VTDISLKYLLFGEDRSAGKTMKSVGDEAKNTGSHFKTSVVAGAAVAGAAVLAFGKISVDKFKEVGAETLGLMRIMGGTAEQASELRFAASQAGVTYETLAKSTGKFEKSLDAARGSTKATSAMVKLLGFDFRDAHGHIKPMSDLMPAVADRFAKMPAGAEKTALAMKLFGKAGADMLPFLNKGSEGIAHLEKMSDKYGLTLTGKNLEALKKSKASQREWNASLDGLRVQLGAQVLPAMTALIGIIRDKVIPIIVDVSSFFQKHADVLKFVGVIVGTLVVGIKAWSIAQGILNTVMAMNPIGLVVIAIAALAAGLIYAYKHSEKFRAVVSGAFNAVGDAFSAVWDVIKGGFDWLKDHWKLILGILTGPIGAAVILIASHWDQIVGFVKAMPGRIGAAAVGMWDGIKDSFRAAINWLIDKWNDFHLTIGGGSILGQKLPSITLDTPNIPHLATGGIVRSPTVALIGEAGPEAVVPLSGAGGMGGINVTVNVHGSVVHERDLARSVRDELAQLVRRRGGDLSALGLASA
jgi:hypothetical protein